MKTDISTTESLEELRVFLQNHEDMITEEENSFVSQLIKDWDERILSKKLIEFHQEELAQQIDSINPNQSRHKICRVIYTIIVQPKPKQENNEPFDYHIGESYTSGIEFGVYL